MKFPAVSSAPLLLTALLAPAWLAGCSPSATYGTGKAPELAIFSEITGGILGGGKQEQIDYQPRAPLVMPPTEATAQLPAPANTASAASADWPVDPDERVALVGPPTNAHDVNSGGTQADYRRTKPLAGMFPAAPRERIDPMDPHPTRDIVHSKEQQAEFRRAVAEAEGYGSGERRYLTDPPSEYREPAATAPAQFEDIDTSGGGGGFVRWLFNRGGG